MTPELLARDPLVHFLARGIVLTDLFKDTQTIQDKDVTSKVQSFYEIDGGLTNSEHRYLISVFRSRLALMLASVMKDVGTASWNPGGIRLPKEVAMDVLIALAAARLGTDDAEFKVSKAIEEAERDFPLLYTEDSPGIGKVFEALLTKFAIDVAMTVNSPGTKLH